MKIKTLVVAIFIAFIVDSANAYLEDIPSMRKVGNAERGYKTFMDAGCIGCHSVKSTGLSATMKPTEAAELLGANPPDLSNVGSIFDSHFLAAFIKNPAHALKVEHKFTGKKKYPYPMVPFRSINGDLDQEVADIVAYLKYIAKKPENITPKMAFETACGRCHSLRTFNWTQIGKKPKFNKRSRELSFELKVAEYQEYLAEYLSKLPPDLSEIAQKRQKEYLKQLIKDPQSKIPGTAMPRVGVTEEMINKIIQYLFEASFSKNFNLHVK
ncbi:c-type cytochrome [Hydrogenimonas thermophila]|uniref:Ubiquinol-cytochrome c reductase cytochrome c1 subunit n=1 Tax=Hydrogenimonas thermophila TaxID=223786 RepID=A0A1I5LY17_9BACT|nr:c-type cytochrome [Hydrogenimonas thermophila]WOE70125.1 c-type cytochrome [Hydrogenimonas thermophila]WOE72642.1 c-type cytochrome [Hydrogenimonas thermophila]SFP02120.1 ubiquinol-cytochrome c reductase cytochrome c1 subunit [Hydrogenimonas thermophila]